jgi:hypothetical protein
VLKLNLPGPYQRICASCVIEKTSLICVSTPVYVAGLLRGVFQIGDWSIITALSKFSSHCTSLCVPTVLLALLRVFARWFERISFTRLDLPEPDAQVTTTKLERGKTTSTF